MASRSAVNTIKGYFYQFDNTILELLKQKEDSTQIIIEGVEDIDVETDDEKVAIQCKYYEGTRYNHSIIGKPIRYMLEHFSNCIKSNNAIIKYLLRGCYESGQEKLSSSIDIDFLKEKFLTFTEKGTRVELHKVLSLSDDDLKLFLDNLMIDINAESYDKQLDEIFRLLKQEFNCNDNEAEYFYYNNCLKLIKELSIQPDERNRTITRQDFILRINTKKVLFTEWFIQYKSKKQYIEEAKKNVKSLSGFLPSKEKIILIGKEVLSENNTELPIESFIENLIEKHYKLGKNLYTVKTLTIILEESIEEIKRIKSNLIEKNIIFNDGYEHIKFSPSIFNEDPIINTGNKKNINKITKSSYIVRLISKDTFDNYYQYIKEPRIFLNFSRNHVEYPSHIQYFDYKYCDSLGEIYKILTSK